ncbi:hypothetical protein [Mesorhizobium sp. 2RAF21]|uniref:hypothetical protein n=1 Tax=Mesorhizobium sp. 2RAF21 TaxID=3232995 RepID=UPI003F9E8C18
MSSVAQLVKIEVPAGFQIEELRRGRVAISVPRGNEGTVEWLKAHNAKWDRERRAWAVPGTKRSDVASHFGRMVEKEVQVAAAEMAEKEAAKAAITEKAAIFKQIDGLRIVGSAIEMAFPYCDGAVAVARKLPGAKWIGERKVWRSMPTSTADVDAIIAGCRQIIDMVAVAREERRAVRESEDKARMAVRAELESRRMLVAVGQVRVGQTMEIRDRLVTVTDLGKAWMMRSEDACMYGMMPEDKRVQYAYHRPATDKEVSAHEERQAATRIRAEELKARKEAIAAANREMDARGQYLDTSAIDHASIKAGEIVLEEAAHLRPYGGGTTWVVADQTLWRLCGNGADGDDWSRSNHGSTIAVCMPAEEGIVSGLRGIGAAQ